MVGTICPPGLRLTDLPKSGGDMATLAPTGLHSHDRAVARSKNPVGWGACITAVYIMCPLVENRSAKTWGWGGLSLPPLATALHENE